MDRVILESFHIYIGKLLSILAQILLMLYKVENVGKNQAAHLLRVA